MGLKLPLDVIYELHGDKMKLIHVDKAGPKHGKNTSETRMAAYLKRVHPPTQGR
jgi:hypothetical protein